MQKLPIQKNVIDELIQFPLPLGCQLIKNPGRIKWMPDHCNNQSANLRQMENLNRGLIAVKVKNGVYVGWRLFGTDPETISFNLYRNGMKVNPSPITTSTNYLDQGGEDSSLYSICAVINGEEQPPSENVDVWDTNYLTIPLNKPEG